MGFIHPGRGASNRTPMPATESPDLPPRKAPELSPKRKAAIEKLLESGRCRSVAHCLFMHKAGALELPE